MQKLLAKYRLSNNETDRNFLGKALEQYADRHNFATPTNYGYTWGDMWILRDIAKYHPTRSNEALAQDMEDRIKCAR